jgi:hypothetical protein
MGRGGCQGSSSGLIVKSPMKNKKGKAFKSFEQRKQLEKDIQHDDVSLKL